MEFEATNKLKRKIYIYLFTLFGLLFGVFLSGFVEVIYIKLLMSDFITYSFGLSWEELNQFGFVFGAVLTVACGLWGNASGKYWWKIVYVIKKYGQKS